jgi:hypothetical protein
MSTRLQALAAARIREVLPGIAVYEGPAVERVEISGGSVIEVFDTVAWAAPRHTADCRLLHLNVLSDCSRNELREPLADDADALAWILYEVFNPLFHDVGRQWREVVTSYRSDGPTLTRIPDSEFGVMLTARYEVIL